MSGVHRRDHSRQVTTVESPAGTSVVSVRGYASYAVGMFAMETADNVAAQREVGALIFDLLALDGFEPGLPMKIIQWLSTRESLTIFGLITTSPTLLATLRAAEVMLPQLVLVASSSQSECVNRAAKMLRDRLRSTTGVRSKLPSRISARADKTG